MRLSISVLAISVLAICVGASASRAGVPELYDLFSPASRVDHLAFVLDENIGEDLNGDDVPDNVFGALLRTIAGLLDQDFNLILQEEIASGSLNIGLIWVGEEEVEDRQDVLTDVASLIDPDGNLATPEWLIDRESFEEGTDRLRNRIAGGTIDGGSWDARGLRFPLVIPLADLLLQIDIIEAHLQAELEGDENGWTALDGTISGAVALEDLFSGINTFLSSTACACLDAEQEPIIFFDEDAERWACRPVVSDRCGDEDAVCTAFADFCGIAVTLFSANADIDLDLDGELDAISLFVEFSAEPATVIGLDGAADCDQNGIPDDIDIESGALTDLNGDGIPDECLSRVLFNRGDPDSSGVTDLSDGVSIFNFLFLGGDSPACAEAADANNSGAIDISDGIALLNFLFLGGVPPAPPGPPTSPCGSDPDVAGSEADLGCESYNSC